MNLNQICDYTISPGSAYQIFPKLCQDNYFTWQASMRMVLETINQWRFMSRELTSPVRKSQDALTKEELKCEEVWGL
jgi:cytochrome c